MRGLVSRSRSSARCVVVPGGALLGVSAVLLVVMAFPAAASQTHKPKHKGDGSIIVSKAPYGTLADGTAIDQFTLANKHGMTVKIITYGGIVTEINMPGPRRQASRTSRSASTTSPTTWQEPVLRRDHRALCESHREWQVHARRQTYTLAQEQRPERAARRHQGLRQGGVDRATDRARRASSSATRARTARRAIPARSSRRDLHAHEQERAEDRLPRHDRQGDGRQPHEPHLLQSGGEGVGRHPRPRARGSRRTTTRRSTRR